MSKYESTMTRAARMSDANKIARLFSKNKVSAARLEPLTREGLLTDANPALREGAIRALAKLNRQTEGERRKREAHESELRKLSIAELQRKVAKQNALDLGVRA